ncbi:plasmodesmata-located protein 1, PLASMODESMATA-LOCATED PROTEIN 1A [Hibiscus trionum]|uniref:Plasmodesmata-located protein 1, PLASMODESMATA-LOCATED PROTEIN 1A n=1 Tax=Hibiscus trionum TaxID=183268 RepID=A0A9W7H187_HIBTR|nr:plasmodesmata-located protein 1, PLASMODESMATA-LOCATED PROTEIN 1A [Hibiscus trionum]
MGLPRKSLHFLYVSLFPITILGGFFTSFTTAADNTNLVFKGCADQKFQDASEVYLQNLKSLMSTLVSQSSEKPFSAASSGADPYAITGLYQCRGDLTITQCYTCVSRIPEMSDKLCGKAVAARVQLTGCYLRYEIVGFKQVPGTEFLYKACGSSKASGTEFESRRDAAFNTAENGVKSGGNSLFYAGQYQSVYVLGQCEGDLGTSDCGDCVKSAFETAKNGCGDSVSGQVYLHKCYISYSYHSNGVPTISSPSGTGTRQSTQRTVAIAVGGVAAVGFIIVCLMFLKSVFKKRRSKHSGYVPL